MSTYQFSKAAAWTLIGAGVLAFVFGVISIILALLKPASGDLLQHFILIIVGLLCAGLGEQRLGPIEEVLNFVKNNRRLSWLATGEDVYKTAGQMVRNCKDENIRATDLLPYDKGEGFEKYFTAVVNKMEAAGVVYRLVLAADEEGWGRKGLERRRRLMVNNPALLGQLRAKHVDKTFPLEVLIIGSSVMLGFPNEAESHHVTRGILIDDQEVAGQFVQWYDDFLWSRASPEVSTTGVAKKSGGQSQ